MSLNFSFRLNDNIWPATTGMASPIRRVCTDTFLNIFKRVGRCMVEMSRAKTQFLTHTIN